MSRFEPVVVFIAVTLIVAVSVVPTLTAPSLTVRTLPSAPVLPAADFPWSPGKNPAEKVIKLNSLLKDYCNKNKLTYVDYYSAMDNGKGGLKVPEHTTADDLVHPNKAGYAVMEGVILKALNN